MALFFTPSPITWPLTPRARLAEWLPAPLPAAWVLVAGPGAGKTSVAAAIAEALAAPVAWVAAAEGATAAELLARLRAEHPAGATVILDGAEAMPAAFLAAWLKQASEPYRTIVTSRTPLPVPLARRLALGEIVELGPSELRLSPDEIAAWLDGVDAAGHDLAGWPLGVTSARALAHRHDAGAMLEALVEEELIAPLSAECRALAVRRSPWPSLSAEDGAHALARWGLCLPDGTGGYTWLPLARRLLRRLWEAETPEAERAEVAARLAEADPGAAIALLLDAGRPEAALAVLAHHGKRACGLGAYDRLAGWLATVPAALRATSPDALVLEGALSQWRGELAEAQGRFEHAHALAIDAGNHATAFLALSDLMSMHLQRKDAEAFAAVAEAAAALEAHAEPIDRAGYLNSLACAHFEAGRDDAARAQFLAVLDHPRFGDPRGTLVHQIAGLNLCLIEKEHGAFDSAARHALRSLHLADAPGGRRDVQRICRLYLVEIALLRGDHAEAAAQFTALAGDDPVPEDSYLQAVLSRLTGDYFLLTGVHAEAETHYQSALAAYTAMGLQATPAAGIALAALGVIHRRRGEPEVARRLQAEALALVAPMPRLRALTLLGLAMSDWALGEPAAAHAWLTAAASALDGVTARHIAAAVALARAAVAHRLGREAEAAAALDAGLELVRQGPYYYVAIAQREIAPTLWGLMAAHGHAAILAKIESHFPRAAASIRAELARDAATQGLPPVAAPAVAVRLFGKLEVSVAGEPVSAWPRRKAKALLAFLLREPAGLTRETLAERLFPELDWPEAEHQLDNAASTLRKALEPDLARGRRSRYLLSQDGALRLATDAVWCDMSAFEAAYHEGQRADRRGDAAEALACFERALDWYRGEAFGDPALADWFEPERALCRARAIEMLERIAERHLADGHHEQAQDCLTRLLTLEPAHEPAHRSLMALYARFGQQAMLHAQFARCRQALSDRLDAAPAPETEALYRTLAGG